MGLLRMRTAAFVARPAVRRFSTSVAVTTPAGARTVAVVPGNTSSPALALATMPLTIASNNMPLLMMASRWGLAIGIFLYALIRPNEWDRVRNRFSPRSVRAAGPPAAT